MPTNDTRQAVYHYRSSAITNSEISKPNANDIDFGEIAINYNIQEPSLFIKKSDSTIAQFVNKDYIDDNLGTVASSVTELSASVITNFATSADVVTALENNSDVLMCEFDGTALTPSVAEIYEAYQNNKVVVCKHIVNSEPCFSYLTEINYEYYPDDNYVYGKILFIGIHGDSNDFDEPLLHEIYGEADGINAQWYFTYQQVGSLYYALHTAHNHSNKSVLDKIPNSIAGKAGKVLTVNQTSNGLSFESIPTSLSAMTNDAGFITSADTNDFITSAVTAMTNYATSANVVSALNNKVDKISGKDLSTNDFDNAYKGKLDNIASGAEVNVQADWSVTATTSDAYIKNKPTIPTVPTNVSSFTNDANYITSAVTAMTNYATSANTVSALNNKVDKINGKGLSTNDFDNAYKGKLDGIASGAEVNVQADWSVTATTSDAYIKNKPTIGDGVLTIQKNNTTVDSFSANQASNKTINITVPTTAGDVNALPNSTKYGSSLSLDINPSTYVVTAQLKDQDGNNLGTAQTIDLPLETMVVSGSYITSAKTVSLILNNGNTIEFSVADLVSGLQSEITAQHPLSADLVADGTTNKVFTATEKTKLSNLASSIATSSNSGYMSSDMVTKLNGIESGAEVNVQADWSVTATTSDAYIKNKPTIPDVSNFITSAVTAMTNYATSANTVSALNNKVDKVTGKDLSTNDFTDIYKGKLDSIASGAEINVQADWNETNTNSDAYIQNKPTIPTTISSLTDTQITNLSDQQILRYDSSSSAWVNTTVDDVFECEFTFTPDSSSTETFPKNCIITCNKTIAEIASAATSGKRVIAKSDFSNVFGSELSGSMYSYFNLTNVWCVVDGGNIFNILMFDVEIFCVITTLNFRFFGSNNEGSDLWNFDDVIVKTQDLYKLTQLEPVATGGTLDSLNDAFIFNATSGQVLQYNGTEWVNITLPQQTSETINITYSELVGLMQNENLVPGQAYRITDYKTTTALGTNPDITSDAVHFKSAEHPFDLVVTAISTSMLDCKASAVLNLNDSYFSASGNTCDLSKWEIWYDVNNDTSKYEWADTTNGKGVIYRMIDDLGNDCPYDFKNIQFKRKLTNGVYNPTNGTWQWVYTFNQYISGTLYDSTLKSNLNVYGNVFKTNSKDTGTPMMYLNDNVFLGDTNYCNTFGFDCGSNTFTSCRYNTFGDGCFDNVLRVSSHNTFGDRFCNNTFMFDNHYNVFGCDCSTINANDAKVSGCYFGDRCSTITFNNPNPITNSVFGIHCTDITINGGNCLTFGNNCNSITVYHNTCYNIEFRNGCKEITLGDSSGNNGEYIRNVVFGDECYCVRLYKSASAAYYLQNIYIAPRVAGTGQNYVEISTIERNLSYTTKVARNSSGVLKIYNEADLVL